MELIISKLQFTNFTHIDRRKKYAIILKKEFRMPENVVAVERKRERVNTRASKTNNTNSPSKIKKAFTLAEVLITLTIIGVVSAMTIPTMMKNHQAITLSSQFKTAYSLLDNAIKMIVAENPSFYEDIQAASKTGGDGNLAGKPELTTPIMEKLHTTRNCVLYKETDCDKTLRLSSYRNFTNTANGSAGWAYAGYFDLKNGMRIYPICSGSCANIHLFIDINGFNKKPNRQGHDLFDFQVNEYSQLVPAWQHGTSCNRNSKSEFAGFDCTKEALSNANYFKNLPK